MASSISSRSRSLLHRIEGPWDRGRFAVKQRLGLLGQPLIVPFRGYGDAGELWCRGRMIEDQGVVSAPHTESLAQNIWLTIKRYETDEVRGARIRWRLGSQTGETVTDEEGFFAFTIRPEAGDLAEAPWQTVELELLEAPGYDNLPLGAELKVRTPSPNGTIGVVSDIDDTIIQTGAWDFMKHWRTVVANSAESREPFAGLAPFYRALANGVDGPETNPIFYVSSSPWNLFDLFERFMSMHGIPLGPMLLKDFGLNDNKWLTGGHSGHKSRMIEDVMRRFPHLKFILVGDSGQHDAHIYRAMAEEHPDRVAAVFIREVSGNGAAEHMKDLAETLDKLSIPFASGENLGHAAEIARDKGWISAEDAAAVDRGTREPGTAAG